MIAVAIPGCIKFPSYDEECDVVVDTKRGLMRGEFSGFKSGRLVDVLPDGSKRLYTFPMERCTFIVPTTSRQDAAAMHVANTYGWSHQGDYILCSNPFDAARRYQITKSRDAEWACSCDDFTHRSGREPGYACKHILAFGIINTIMEDPTPVGAAAEYDNDDDLADLMQG